MGNASQRLTAAVEFGEYLGPHAPMLFAVRSGLPAMDVLREASNILESAIEVSKRLGNAVDGSDNSTAVQIYALERLLTMTKALVDSLVE